MKTIIQYDKILVLKDGEMVEYAAPADLLTAENGVFRGMVMRQGRASYDSMLQLALAKKNAS